MNKKFIGLNSKVWQQDKSGIEMSTVCTGTSGQKTPKSRCRYPVGSGYSKNQR